MSCVRLGKKEEEEERPKPQDEDDSMPLPQLNLFGKPNELGEDTEDESQAGDRRQRHVALAATPVPKPVFFEQKTPRSLSVKRSKRSRPASYLPCSPAKISLSVNRLGFLSHRRKLDLSTPHPLHGDGTAKAVSFETPNTPLMFQKQYVKTNGVGYFDQFYDKVRKLGEGDFGEVVEAVKKVDGKRVAIKKSRQQFLSKFDRKRMLAEVQAFESVPTHANILRFEEAWEEKGFLFIQTELCQASLQQYMEEKPVDEVMSWNLLCDVLTGLAHIHDHDYIHLDIKPDNILIGQDGRYKIGDLGLMAKISDKNTNFREGDNRTMAPETLHGDFTIGADVFSLGMTVLCAACDIELPKNGELWHKFRSGQPFQECDLVNTLPRDMRELLEQMLHPDPKKRPSCRELLQNSIIRRMTITLLLSRRATNNNQDETAMNLSPGLCRQRSPAITPSSNRRSSNGTCTPIGGSPIKSPIMSPLSTRPERVEEKPETMESDPMLTSLKCPVSKNLLSAFHSLNSSDEDEEDFL